MAMRCSWLRLPLLSLSLTSLIAASGILWENTTAQAQIPGYCQSSKEAAIQKEEALRKSVGGDQAAKQRYQVMVKRSSDQLRACRAQSWPQTQAIWLRLYECDLKPGVLDSLMDRLVNRGYNRVNIEVFYSGQVLLPTSENPTLWPSIVRKPEYAQRDLLAEAMQKARERGLQPYAWTFSLNYGYEYGNRPDRQGALARNGSGKPSSTLISSADPNIDITGDTDKVFVDPYSPQARQDFRLMLDAIAKRKPNGILFDYIRYPRQTGGASVASKTSDLWIFGRASQNVFLSRATNSKGQAVLKHYMAQGALSAGTLAAFDQRYASDGAAMWQGRRVPTYTTLPSAASRIVRLNHDLWLLSVAHAYQGVVDFLTAAANPVQQQGIKAGAVFFPGANRRVGRGFDSRMQPWDQFPTNIEWTPMAYAVCGNSTDCIAKQVQQVLATAPNGTQVSPAIAGAWGGFSHNRPSLEAQMQAIRRVAPQVRTVSHFDFSWQDPAFSNARRSCRVDYGA
ncbi:MAG: hypothetical protein AAF329_10100 [Cyanobacteria bacterium P01_A01_bin.17]